MENTDIVRTKFEIFLTELAQDYKALKAAGNDTSVQTNFVNILSDLQLETLILFLQEENNKDFTKSFITCMITYNVCQNKNTIQIINSFKDIFVEIKSGIFTVVDKNMELVKFLYDCHDEALLERQYCILGSELRYHKDWNDLMEIITKINSFQQCENARRDLQYTIAYLLGGGYRFSEEKRDVLDMTIENLFERSFEWVVHNKNLKQK
jgi:hypothetical protein